MSVLNKEKFFEIINDGDAYDWKDYEDKNGILIGLQIVEKYLPNDGIEADHDIIYSADVERLVEAGITIEDVESLRNHGWFVDESDSYIAHFC